MRLVATIYEAHEFGVFILKAGMDDRSAQPVDLARADPIC